MNNTLGHGNIIGDNKFNFTIETPLTTGVEIAKGSNGIINDSQTEITGGIFEKKGFRNPFTMQKIK